MRKLSAHFIFPLNSEPFKNGIIIIDKNGTIIDLTNTGGRIKEIDRLEFHNGIIIPGFEGLTIKQLFQKQVDKEDNLNNILQTEIKERLVVGEKVNIYLISNLDLQNLRLTEKSKLKKLV